MLNRIDGEKQGAPLPKEYTKMIEDVLTQNFDLSLKTLGDLLNQRPRFKVNGAIFSKEVFLRVALAYARRFLPIEIYGSCNFDAKANVPTSQELLGACVDVIGELYSQLLSQPKVEVLAKLSQPSESGRTVSQMKMLGIPLEWQEIRIENYKVFVKLADAGKSE